MSSQINIEQRITVNNKQRQVTLDKHITHNPTNSMTSVNHYRLAYNQAFHITQSNVSQYKISLQQIIAYHLRYSHATTDKQRITEKSIAEHEREQH